MPYREEDVVTLNRTDGTFCKIHLFGATIINWTNKNKSRLFLSSKAAFDGKSAIRGGIPIVFPHFGPWMLGPQHGFSRISWWTLETQPVLNKDGTVQATFGLKDNDSTRQMWPYKFELTLIVELSEDNLKTTFKVINTDATDFSFTCLLHTYFDVLDVESATVEGIKDENSVEDDRVNGKKGKVVSNRLSFAGAVDSIFHNTSSVHKVSGEVGIEIMKDGFPDTVIWNPWKEKAAQMTDMGKDEWKRMLCVEVGRVVEPVELKPGGSFCASQIIKAL